MNATQAQLERLAAAAQRLLLWQRLVQWLTVVVIGVWAMLLSDYVLRLPPVARAVLGVVLVGTAVSWGVRRWRRVRRFDPPLSLLALRIERMYPALRGRLAAAIDFGASSARGDPSSRTASLMRLSREGVEPLVQSLPVRRLIDPRLTVYATIAAAAVAVLTTVAAVSMPAHAAAGWRRWVDPFGGHAWPQRVVLVTQVSETVWPNDAPLPLTVRVERGYRPKMRVWAMYRFEQGDPGREGPWQRLLMNDQGTGRRFERMVDLPAEVAQASQAVTLSLCFMADDGQTPTQTMTLRPRPRVMGMTATVEPPAYAQGLVPVQTRELAVEGPGVATVSALMGSTLTLDITTNGPVPAHPGVLPGLSEQADLVVAGSPTGLRAVMRVVSDADSTLELRDADGLMSQSPRRYRLEALADQPPTVAITLPRGDESVLSTAVVPVAAESRDDVAVGSLSVVASGLGDAELSLVEGLPRTPVATTQTELDLTGYALTPGSEVTLTAVAGDVLPDHAPVRSSPRRLRVIDAAAFIGLLRSDLAALRQQALRLAERQQELMSRPTDRAVAAQEELAAQVGGVTQTLDELTRRVERNRLADEAIDDLLSRGSALAKQAAQQAETAAQRLPDDEAAGREAQRASSAALADLVSLLDQGRDALALQLQLRQLAAQQAQARQQLRQQLPRTLGRTLEQLSEQERQGLDEQAAQQASLAESADALVRQMQQTSESLARNQHSPQERAAAEALSRAAAVAQRQGLAPMMRRAAGDTGENRMAQADQALQQVEQVLDAMLEELQAAQRLEQQVLRRMLEQLAEAIERLIAQQDALTKQLDRAQDPAALLEGARALRGNTLALAEETASSRELTEVTPLLRSAGERQQLAAEAMGRRSGPEAQASFAQARAHLEAALRLVRELSEQAAAQQTQQAREALRKAYLALAARQTELADAVEGLLGQGQLTRRERADLLERSHEQDDLAAEARALGEQVAQTLLFRHLHARVDELAALCVRTMRAGDADAGVVADQQRIALMLTRMAQALAEEGPSGSFAQGGGDGGGGGGGGGGAGQAPPLVPPMAELKLLKHMQGLLLDDTVRASETLRAGGAGEPGEPGEPGGAARRMLLQLAAQQRELAGLGERLIEQLKAQQGGAVPVEPRTPQVSPQDSPQDSPQEVSP